MAKKKVGELIKEARTGAGYTQAELASLIDGLSASDLSKAERNEKELTQAQLKAIAKLTGVTQKSLLEAASGSSSASKKKASSSGTSMKVTATEKKVIELYRAADSDTKKAAVAILKGQKTQVSGIISSLLKNSNIMDTISGVFRNED